MISSSVALLTTVDRPSPASPTTPARLSVVVKPFTNLTGRDAAQAFAAALDDEILSQLAVNEKVTVFRSEALGALPPTGSPARNDHKLGRLHILEGVIRTGDTKLRITGRLLDGETSAIIWSDIYEADQTNSGFDLETSLAAKIAAAVNLRLQRR